MTSESDLEATVRDVRVGCIAWCRGESTRAQAATDFDRFIARVKAEALREAHERIGQATRNGDNFFSALLDEADRIEREAGL